jgi:CheY-like chemotaxis protein
MPGGRGRVLIVDDQEDMRFLLGMIFDEDGYEVQVAEDGEKGLALAQESDPALIILDLKMPGIGGWEVVARLRRARRPPPPVILVSGAREEITRGSLGPPVAGFLLKPFRVHEVLAMAARALEEARKTEPEEPPDRRREPRRAIVMPGKLLGADGQPIALGSILDLSRGGARFDLGISLEPGRKVEIAVEVPGLDAPLRLEGEIRWSKEGALGVQFSELTPAQMQQLEGVLDDGRN